MYDCFFGGGGGGGGIYCSQLDKEEEVEEVEPGRGGQINTCIEEGRGTF